MEGFRLSTSLGRSIKNELKWLCLRLLTPSDFHFLNQNVLGGAILFFWNQYSNSPHEIVIYSINRKSYNKEVNILWKLNKCATDSSIIYE